MRATARASVGANGSKRSPAFAGAGFRLDQDGRRRRQAALPRPGPQQALVRTDRRLQPHPPGQPRGDRHIAERRRSGLGVGTAVRDHNFRPPAPQPLSAISDRTAVNHSCSGCDHEYFSSLLGLLKQRWGLSVQGWIRRARDLDIIGTDLYRSLNIQFRSRGWHRSELFHYESSESTTLFERLVFRAVPEHMITSEEAERFFPSTSCQQGASRSSRTTLRDLARQSLEQRYRVLRGRAVEVSVDETEAWDELPNDEVE